MAALGHTLAGYYLDTRAQPTRTVNYGTASWPPRVSHQEFTEIVITPSTNVEVSEYRTEPAVYGGGRLIGPLTNEQYSDLWYAGYGFQVIYLP